MNQLSYYNHEYKPTPAFCPSKILAGAGDGTDEGIGLVSSPDSIPY